MVSRWDEVNRLKPQPKVIAALTGLERILAQLIGIAVRSDDEDACAAALALVPDVVAWDILAFNLACFHAVKGNRGAMLAMTARSLELGKSPTQFENDDDFAAWLDDADFQALLQSVA